MARFNLSSDELKLIRTVLVFSVIGSTVLVGGTWIYFRLQLKREVAKKETAAQLNNSTAIIPIDLEAHATAASRYLQVGAPEKAIPHLERLYALNKKDRSTLTNLAHASLEAGFYQQAVDYYNDLYELTAPDSITAAQCSRRGIALFYLDEVEQSREALYKCIEKFPQNAEAYCFLGQIEAYRKMPSDSAVAFFNRSIAIDSTYTEAWYQLARYYMKQKVYTKARELLLHAVAINPFHSKSHSRLGMVYYYLDYPQLAEKSYRTSLVLNPYDFNTCYNLGELLYGVLEDTTAALKEFKRAYALNPRLYEAAFKIGLVCMKNNMNKEAVRYFEQALKESPGDIRILMQCAVAWERLDRIDKATECYRTILTYDELNVVARQKIKLLAAR